jgi:hypothetical protein
MSTLVEKFDNIIRKQVIPISAKIMRKRGKLYVLWSDCLVENIFAKLAVRHNLAISEGMKEIGLVYQAATIHQLV